MTYYYYCSLDPYFGQHHHVHHHHHQRKSCRKRQEEEGGGDRRLHHRQLLKRNRPSSSSSSRPLLLRHVLAHQLSLLLFLLLAIPIAVSQPHHHHHHHHYQNNNNNNNKNNIRRIAIIGGGLGGSFTAKYLVDYDHDCALQSIVIFEAMPLPVTTTTTTTKDGGGATISVHDDPPPNAEWQGSRVTSLRLDLDDDYDDDDDEAVVLELGASIGHSGFHYVLEMIANDPEHLQLIPPLSTGRSVNNKKGNKNDISVPKKSFGIYNGHGKWTLVNDDTGASASSSATTTPPSLTSRFKTMLNQMRLVMRYNWDLIKVHRACTQAMTAFAHLPNLLDDNDDSNTDDSAFFPESPNDIWYKLGLHNLVHSSFAQFLDALSVQPQQQGSGDDSYYYWRRLFSLSYWFPSWFGSLRDELLTAMNLVNYNQDTNQVNALVGLGSFAASVGGLFSVRGGNYNIVLSAQRQANDNRRANCGHHRTSSSSSSDVPFVQQVHKRITTVVGSLGEGFTLYAAAADDDASGQEQQETVGQFDIVVLAAPLQMARINFLVKSHVDESVLVPMPLGGLVDAEETTKQGVPQQQQQQQQQHRHEGHSVGLPSQQLLPDSVKRPYTQVVTTIISNATLSSELFGIAAKDATALLPASILVTAAGKAELYNMTVIRRMMGKSRETGEGGGGGLYRTFSDAPLPDSVLTKIFGPAANVEYVKVWGGPHGGATPDYQGQGDAPPFLLYDASTGLQHHTTSGALYYPSAMELSTLASMEMSAVGAKVVAKLCAKRLGLLPTRRGDGDGIKDEL
jgi:prenylcysteine oxidase / farnesylcysteine lyase